MGRWKSLLNGAVFREFIKYAVVGGVSFLVDAGVLALFYYVIFCHVEVLFWNHFDLRTILATAAGFVAGLLVNYILSIRFVFNKDTQKKENGKAKSFLIYTVVGVIGFVLTELGMTLGRVILGTHYNTLVLLVKVVVAGIVLIWNYLGRKIFVYKWA